MSRFTKGLATALLVTLALPFAAAQHAHGAAGTEVALTVTEEGFEAPETLQAGYTTFTLQNELEARYNVTIYRLEEGTTAEEVQAAEEAIGQAFAEEGDVLAAIQEFFEVAVLLSGPAAAPGEQNSLGVVLEPGRYALIGQAFGGPEEEGEPMAQTVHEFEVTESEAPAEAPEADVRVNMLDYAFEMPAEIGSGSQLWEVANSGAEVHHVDLVRLLEGRTLADVMTFFETEEGELPFEEAGHIEVVSPGHTVYATVELEPGNYLAICWIPQHGGEELGPPHAVLGMVQPFTVEGEQ